MKRCLDISWLELRKTGGPILANTKYTVLFNIPRWLPSAPKQCSDLLYSDPAVDEPAVLGGSRRSLVHAPLVDRMLSLITYYCVLLSANKVFHLRSRRMQDLQGSNPIRQHFFFFPLQPDWMDMSQTKAQAHSQVCQDGLLSGNSLFYLQHNGACMYFRSHKKETNSNVHKYADLRPHGICFMTLYPLFCYCIRFDKYYPRITLVLQTVFIR